MSDRDEQLQNYSRDLGRFVEQVEALCFQEHARGIAECEAQYSIHAGFDPQQLFLDVPARLSELREQLVGIQDRSNLLRAFARDKPLHWLQQYDPSNYTFRFPMGNFLGDVLRERLSLHAALADFSARCIVDLQTTANVDAAAEMWHETLMQVGNGSLRGSHLRNELVCAMAYAGELPNGQSTVAPADNSTEQAAEATKNEASLDTRATAIYANDMSLKKVEIAKILGVSKSCLNPSRCPTLHVLYQAHKGVPPPRGSKSREGQIEAWEDKLDDDAE